MPAERVVDLKVQTRFGEMYSAFLRFSFHKLRLLFFVAALIFVLTGLVLIHANQVDPPDDRWTNFAENVKPLFNLAWIFFLLIPVTSLLNAARIQRDPRTKGGFNYHITDGGIRVEGSTGSNDYNWTAFSEASEVSGAFFLFVTGALFHIIPKRCFASPEDINVFREIIRTNVSKSKLR